MNMVPPLATENHNEETSVIHKVCLQQVHDILT